MFEIDGEEYELRLVYDEDTEEYVAAYYIGDEMVNVGRANSVNSAVAELARDMEEDIRDVLGEV